MGREGLEPIIIKDGRSLTKGWVMVERQPDPIKLGVGAPIGDPVLAEVAIGMKRVVKPTPDISAFYTNEGPDYPID